MAGKRRPRLRTGRADPAARAPRKPRKSTRAASSEEIAQYAWAELYCRNCGSEPRSACIAELDPPRTVCRERFVDAVIELRKQERARSPQALETAARLDIATERGIFMSDVPDADVAARLGSMRAKDPEGLA